MEEASSLLGSQPNQFPLWFKEMVQDFREKFGSYKSTEISQFYGEDVYLIDKECNGRHFELRKIFDKLFKEPDLESFVHYSRSRKPGAFHKKDLTIPKL